MRLGHPNGVSGARRIVVNFTPMHYKKIICSAAEATAIAISEES
ncbi:hypothetical protein [Coxiella-like endosymbiont]|nr:hypothetical protein [Coxiella-like endosymbiont]